MKQSIVTLDMEGVLTPEVWIAVAERTGVPELRHTTRDEPDYDKLMLHRIDLMKRHGVTLSLIQETIAGLPLLIGARTFLDALRQRVPVVILSDTFEQFAQPFLRQLAWPTLLCHRLIVEKDRITGYKLRLPDQKKSAVKALQSLNYSVIAAGDSFNDTSMLAQADHGILFHAAEGLIRQFPQFPSVNTYDELLRLIEERTKQSGL